MSAARTFKGMKSHAANFIEIFSIRNSKKLSEIGYYHNGRCGMISDLFGVWRKESWMSQLEIVDAKRRSGKGSRKTCSPGSVSTLTLPLHRLLGSETRFGYPFFSNRAEILAEILRGTRHLLGRIIPNHSLWDPRIE